MCAKRLSGRFFFIVMTKPLLQFCFHEIGGVWRDITYPEQKILADVLEEYEIIIDDRTQFARLYDYRRELCIWYRAYSCGKITITIWRI